VPRPLRVLHTPHAVAGHAAGLAAAERELGLDSDHVVLGAAGARRELRRWQLLARALRDYDVVHFNFGATFLPRRWPSVHRGRRAPYGAYARLVALRDVDLLRRAGKAVFVTYQGDDVRTAESLRNRLHDSAWLDSYYDRRDDEEKARSAARLSARADGVFVLNPDLVDLVPGAEFLPYASVDLREWSVLEAPRHARPVVVHAPTDRRTKGTQHVLAALGSRADVELRVVEGVSRADVRDSLARADVYVDQLLIGWYGGTAVEAMALGRPVVAYLHEADLGHLPAAMRDELPIVRATPETLSDAVDGAVARRDELGRRGRAFVERWHDPLHVAARTKAAYERAVASMARR
jgi:glycosyltransferase involved in cell wall biosynthesis